MKTAEKRTFSTPMMRQYMEIKEKYKDCLLFFRLGDFYELFLEDAIIGAKVLDIVLTRRPRGKDGDIPMAGVPYHSADNYIARLVKAGYKIAICEQTSEPDNKGIVEREVVRIVTPGTVMDEKSLVKNESNYVMALKYNAKHLGLAFMDLSTGKFQVTQIEHKSDHKQFLTDEIRRFSPAECVLSLSQYSDRTLLKTISETSSVNIYDFDQWDSFAQQYKYQLKKHFNVESLQGFGIDEWVLAQQAASALLGYINHTQRRSVNHITQIESYHPEKFVKLDDSTVKNLELFQTIRERDQEGSFIRIIDKTKTPMGGRLLKEWIRKPLMDINEVNARLEAVETLFKNAELTNEVTKKLDEVRDIERTLARLAVNLGNARDLNNLKDNLQKIIQVKKVIPKSTAMLKQINNSINEKSLQSIIDTIELNIASDPPSIITEGGMFRNGVHKELDLLRAVLHKGSGWLKDFEASERDSTQIPTLKVRFNKVFGFYIEVSKPHVDKIPDHYIRKQTMVSAERYVTEALKQHEKEVLSAEEKIQKLEQKLFLDLIKKVMVYTIDVQKAARAIAEMDCINSFTLRALQNNYTQPVVTQGSRLKIIQGRHPVVEEMVAKGEFVPNDTLLNDSDHQLIILTGPNMAGKSVYIRQVALITLMAHIGMFVPADQAEISLVDRIFVRSGASDMISSGLSTFMVEMVETANILNNASPKSLIIMDEVGRGTSTYDGISIASSVVEYLVTNSNKQAKTLFATHYHELQELESLYANRVKNYQMEVKEHADGIIFLHSIVKGKASHSYGIAVAQKAGVPVDVTKKAFKKLQILENKSGNSKTTKNGNKVLEKLRQQINDININDITPLQALSMLSEIKKQLQNE